MLKIIGKFLLILLINAQNLYADALPIAHRSSAGKNTSSKTSSAEQPQVELSLAKDEFFVGEYIPFKLRVIYDAHQYDIQAMTPPADFVVKDSAKPRKWRDSNADSALWICEWEGTFSAAQKGKITVGPFHVTLQQRTTHAMNGWSFFATQYNVVYESNTVSCVALSLPLIFDKEVHPIGHFHAVHLEIDQTHCKAGQAITLRLHLAGQGNVQAQSHPQLTLPDGLKWYASGCKQESDGFSFEYVVQALKEGIFILQPQKCLFFDPEAKQYRTLSSATVRLHVAPGLKKEIVEEQLAEEPPIAQDAQDVVDDIKEQSLQAPALLRRLYIPDSLLMVILVMALLAAFGYRYYDVGRLWFLALKKRWAYRKLLREARDMIGRSRRHVLKKSEDTLHLYEVFKKLQTAIDWERLAKESDAAQEWQLFWQLLEHVRFGDGADQAPLVYDQCMVEAERWLGFFEKQVV